MLADISLSGILWAILWLFLFVIWFWLIVMIFSDLIHDREMSGWGKAAWTLFVIVLPLIGILVYLIARGGGMQERSVDYAKYQRDTFTRYQVQAGATSGSAADELSKLADLHASGALSDEEYANAKAKLL